MALLPSSVAAAGGAVLNQYPELTLTPFAVNTALPSSPTEEAVVVLAPYVPVGDAPASASYRYNFNVQLSVPSPPDPALKTKIRFQFRGLPNAPWSQGNDSSTYLTYIPDPGSPTTSTQSISFGFRQPALAWKYLYVSVIPDGGDATVYSILATSVLTLQRVR